MDLFDRIGIMWIITQVEAGSFALLRRSGQDNKVLLHCQVLKEVSEKEQIVQVRKKLLFYLTIYNIKTHKTLIIIYYQ